MPSAKTELVITVACEIGKHKLCDGTGEDGDAVVTCECPCHENASEAVENGD